jgi:mycofactocin biosynthesis protein MftB
VRPEPFAALLYHFGTRRLSLLKNSRMLAAVPSLADHPTGQSACAAAGVGAGALAAYERALATLAHSQMINEWPMSESAVSESAVSERAVS